MSSKKSDFLCVIVTGMSGAGRSQTIKCLEDLGFYCVDNLPSALLPSFADLMVTMPNMHRVALGIDVREGQMLKNLMQDLNTFKAKNILTWTLFLDATDQSLLRRFSETRRRHPLGKGVLAGIKEERKLLSNIRSKADRIIESSNLTLSDLKEMVASSLPTTIQRALHITVYSFGFKYGVPTDADIVMDVRFLPNPNYVSSLHKKTGLTAAVRNYVMKSPGSKEFLNAFMPLVGQTLPQYFKEGKSHLTIAIGCTGGKHRSVTIAEKLADYIKKQGYPASIHHRDLAHYKTA